MQYKRFAKQVVIITGASGGIGRACVDRFIEEGASVACWCLKETANEGDCGSNTNILRLFCDVTDPRSVNAAVQQTLDKWERIDTLVTSAGIYTGSPLPEITAEKWQKTLNTNLTGVFLTNQAVAPFMIKQRCGSIINLSSMAGKTSWPASMEYSASKSGVIGLTRSVAMELAPYGVTVNAVCPGNTKTAMLNDVATQVGGYDGLTVDQWLKQRASDCPMKRLAEPWEIAGVIAFLASSDARYITGQAIEVDGGMVMS